jgi:hypothetical protein
MRPGDHISDLFQTAREGVYRFYDRLRFHIYDLPSKGRTFIGTATLGPLALYAAQVISQVTPTTFMGHNIPHIPFEYGLLVTAPAALALADIVGGIIAAYGTAALNSLTVMAENVAAWLFKTTPGRELSEIPTSFYRATARVKGEWPDMVYGWLDDALGGLILAFIGLFTHYSNKVASLPMPYNIFALGCLGSAADIIGDMGRAGLKVIGVGLENLGGVLQRIEGALSEYSKYSMLGEARTHRQKPLEGRRQQYFPQQVSAQIRPQYEEIRQPYVSPSSAQALARRVYEGRLELKDIQDENLRNQVEQLVNQMRQQSP